ncbi:MAG: NAD(P)H-dependent oxidoreductase [Dokdonella sp.]|uniref:NADPH-dependent FMN reductase n=1 Tax=Dokdonella sp. TaxID=2291710 RepID=UPI0032632ECA
MTRIHEPIRVLAVCGSLRQESYNRRLLQGAALVAPAGMSVHLHDTIADIPMFDEDVACSPAQLPHGVQRLRDAAVNADGLLIATPEYNQSLPGVLKNTIDWLSRPTDDGIDVLERTPVAIVGATTGPWGTRLAQAQLRQALTATGSFVLPAPMLFVRDASHVFDTAVGCYDADTLGKLRNVLAAFREWITLLPRLRQLESPADG